MSQALAENIFENYDHVVQLAIDSAAPLVQHWHSPVNRDNRELGGYYWATYKAIMRREGVYANALGPHGSYYQSLFSLSQSLGAVVYPSDPQLRGPCTVRSE
jgi:hypothetical protein